jgi:alkylation response protein AidB-like acyl-CoA dehydrogenase
LFIALNGVQGPAESLQEVGTALRRPLRNLGLLSGYAASRIRSRLGASATLDARLNPRLARHKSYFEKHVAELKGATQRSILKHRSAIVDRQLVLERLANMAIELVATACVLSRTQSLIDDRGIDACTRELELCDLFCVEAGRRFRSNRLALEGRAEEIDSTRRAVAATLRQEQRYFVDDAILDL